MAFGELSSKYHCVMGSDELVMASQLRCTSKSVDVYDGTRSSLKHVHSANRHSNEENDGLDVDGIWCRFSLCVFLLEEKKRYREH